MMEENISLNNSEWNIMEELWQGQPKTLMELVHGMRKKQGWSKSTTNTMLRRMQEKGYISYKAGEKARLYFAVLAREDVVLRETESFLKRAYGGSLGMLMNTFVENHQLTAADIEELQQILQKAQEKETETTREEED